MPRPSYQLAAAFFYPAVPLSLAAVSFSWLPLPSLWLPLVPFHAAAVSLHLQKLGHVMTALNMLLRLQILLPQSYKFWADLVLVVLGFHISIEFWSLGFYISPCLLMSLLIGL